VETIATPSFIYNIADEVFCGTVFHGEHWWSTEFAVWEQCWVVFDVGDDHGHVKVEKMLGELGRLRVTVE
jgi:hypothetical protein